MIKLLEFFKRGYCKLAGRTFGFFHRGWSIKIYLHVHNGSLRIGFVCPLIAINTTFLSYIDAKITFGRLREATDPETPATNGPWTAWDKTYGKIFLQCSSLSLIMLFAVLKTVSFVITVTRNLFVAIFWKNKVWNHVAEHCMHHAL